MAIFLNRDMKFTDLSQDLKLLVTKYLSYEEKIKLMDIFPHIMKQSTTFRAMDNIYGDGSDKDKAMEAIKLFRKLPVIKKVVTVVFPRTEFDILLRDEIISGIFHPEIEDFDYPAEEVFQFLSNVRNRDPNYDGSRLKHIFVLKNPSFVHQYLKASQSLNVNLRLITLGWSLEEFINLVRDDRIRAMVTSMRILTDFYYHLKYHPRQFESLNELILRDDGGRPFPIDVHECLQLAPNLKKISLSINFFYPNNVLELVRNLLTIESLESLKLSFNTITTQPQFLNTANVLEAIGTLLMTDHSRLTILHLEVGRGIDWDIKKSVEGFIRHGFRFLRLFNGPSEFEVEKNVLKIRDFDTSLVDIFSKFPHIKHIDINYDHGIDIDDKLNVLRVKEQIVAIRRNLLPRNRWLTCTLVNELTSFREEI